MATPDPPPLPPPPPVVVVVDLEGVERYDAMAKQIEDRISGYHSQLEEKKLFLLGEVGRLKENDQKHRDRDKAIKQIEGIRNLIKDAPTDNIVADSQIESVQFWNDKIETLNIEKGELEPIKEIELYPNSDAFADCIRDISLVEPGDYLTRRKPYLLKGKGEVVFPRGIAIEANTGMVFVAIEGLMAPVVVYSLEGEYLSKFGRVSFCSYAICAYGEFVFITGECVRNIYSVDEDIKLDKPTGLCAYNDKVFLCNSGDNTILVFNLNLKFLNKFGQENLNCPSDIKANNNKIFVLNQSTNSISVFSIEFDFISLITFKELVIGEAFFFVIDRKSNFIISDKNSDCLRVLSPSGEHTDTLGCGYLRDPQGLDIDNNNRIVCVSQSQLHFFQIY